MILINAVLFIATLAVVLKSADYCTTYATHFAKMLNLSEFVVSFFVIALISAFPEASISIFSALDGVPELGLGTLLGSNVADLTLVFGLTALMSSRGIHVRSEILKKDFCLSCPAALPAAAWNGRIPFKGEWSPLSPRGIVFLLHAIHREWNVP